MDKQDLRDKVANLREIFPDLTQSVAAGALLANEKDVNNAFQALDNIGQDVEAKEELRKLYQEQVAQELKMVQPSSNEPMIEVSQLNEDEKRELEKQMEIETQRQLKARQHNLQQTVNLWEKNLLEEKQQQQEYLEKLKKHEEELKMKELEMANLLKRQQEELDKVAELKRQEIREAEERIARQIREQEQQKITAQAFEEQKRREEEMKLKLQEERLAAEKEKLRIQQEQLVAVFETDEHLHRENAKQKEEVETMQNQLKDLQEAKRKLQEHLEVKNKELVNQDGQLKEFKNAIEKMQQEQSVCTLSVQYNKQTVLVSWSLGDNFVASNADWVGFFRTETKNTQYLQYIKTSGSVMGSQYFQTPSSPGFYEFRFFSNGSYLDIARSCVLYIGPELQLSARLEGADIICTWKILSGEVSVKDWIGLYPISHPMSRIDERCKININSNSSSFSIRAPRKPGQYELRFVPHLGYTAVAKSEPIIIPNLDKLFVEKITSCSPNVFRVTWDIRSLDTSSYDWIALYRKGAVDNDYLLFKYNDKVKNELLFDVPELPGDYEVRYHSRIQSKYVHLAATEPITIENKNKVLAVLEGTFIKVTWDIVSPKLTSSDWVALCRVGSSHQSYLTYNYIDQKKGYLLFTKPSSGSGSYIIRYFSSLMPKYHPLAESEELVL